MILLFLNKHLKLFSALISDTVYNDRCDQQKWKLLRDLDIF